MVEKKMPLVIVPVSPLNAPGLMTAKGWDALRASESVGNSCTHPGWDAHVREAGIDAVLLEHDTEHALIGALVEWIKNAEVSDNAEGTCLTWLADSEHPFLPSPPRILARLEERLERQIDAEYVFASPVAPGAAVVESVRIMHELRSPGGDAWSAEQTHNSLARYLLEETYEVLEELDRDPVDETALVNECGDLLFQLVFHARIGTESAQPWDLDSVARALNTKMYRRNPHVFSPVREELSVDDTIEQWQAIKKAERGERSLFRQRLGLGEGIPGALPALQRLFKLVQRAEASGVFDDLDARVRTESDPIARALAEVVLEAAKDDYDPETALRGLIVRIEDAVRPAK